MPERSRAARILLADDDPDTRELYGFILRSHGFDVVEAADGGSAMQELTEHPPDLVITDLRMPGIDGFEICRASSALPEPVPTIVVTALATPAVVARAEAAGAEIVLFKPLSPTVVLEKVRERLKSRGFRI